MKTNWTIDKMHSEIGFKVRHMMISNVRGSFGAFDANLVTEGDDFTNASFEFNADIDSINTGVEDRDGHLKSADFFDAANFPKIEFTSNSVDKSGDDLVINGDLSIHGVTKPVVLLAEVSGIVVDPYGQTKTGMSIKGTIKRSDFGLVWSAVTEAGSVVLSDDVVLQHEIQFIKQ